MAKELQISQRQASKIVWERIRNAKPLKITVVKKRHGYKTLYANKEKI